MLKMQMARRFGVMLAGAGALTALLAPPANAATVARDTAWDGKCAAILYTDAATDKASAGIYQSQTASSSEVCTGFLMRSIDGGAWSIVSGIHIVYAQGVSSYTGWYWNGTDYRARACVSDDATGDGYYSCTAAYSSV